MRTAEEIILKEAFFVTACCKEYQDAVTKAINEARKEAIREAAEVATVNQATYAMINGKRNVTMCAVNKKSILQLINNIQ